MSMDMAVSNAFDKLSAVVTHLAADKCNVQSIDARTRGSGANSEMTAELSVDIPLFEASAIQEGITVQVTRATINGQSLSLNLDVTVPATDEIQDGSGNQVDGGAAKGQSNDGPVYQDPDALATAYAEHETFPEMREALDVDVTPETVRRHMVKYGIHNPEDNTPGVDPAVSSKIASESDSETGDSDQITTTADSDENDTAMSATDAKRTDNQSGTGDMSGVSEANAGSTQADPSANPAGSEPNDVESNDDQDLSLGDKPIADLLSSDKDVEENTIVTDGMGLPTSLTVERLANVINESRTIHEVKQHLEMSQGNTRQLLQELDLINFVSHPLAADKIEVSPEEIVRRIDSDQV